MSMELHMATGPGEQVGVGKYADIIAVDAKQQASRPVCIK